MAKLTPSDIKVLLPELHSICDKWYNIGLQLDLSVDYLEELDSKLFTHKVHVSTCLKRVLVRWLKSNQPTWQALIKVLNSDLVKEKHIADVLRKKYNAISLADKRCTSTTIGAGGYTKRVSPQKPTKIRKPRKRVRQSSVQSSSKKTRYDVELPGSFSIEDFVRTPTADRICIKCGRVPRTPQKSTCCNQLYCMPCSLETSKCWSHKKVTKYISDGELRETLSKLTRKCPNRSYGCDWKGCGWQLSRHLSEMCPKTNSTGHVTKPQVSSTENGDKVVVDGSRKVAVATQSTRKETVTAKSTRKQTITARSSQKQTITAQSTRKETVTAQSTQKQTITARSTQKQIESKQQAHTSEQFLKSPQVRESCYLLKIPPFNLAMENVSEYVDSDEAWLSDGFFSHQIGYKMCLAVRIESSSEDDGMLNVILGIASAEGPHSGFLEYPCSGFVTVMILNPLEDHDHQVLELMFVLEKPNMYVYNEIGGEVVKVPQHFITPVDCLFFQVEKVDMDREQYRLWLLDASLTKDKQSQDGELSDSDDLQLLY